MQSARLNRAGLIRGLLLLGAIMGIPVQAQTAPAPNTSSQTDGWQRYDWLQTGDSKQQASTTGTVTSTSGQDINKDAFSVLSSGALWQEKTDTIYTRKLADPVTLSYETGSTLLNESSNPNLPLAGGTPDGLGRTQKVDLQVQPVEQVTVNGNAHAATTDSAMPGDSTVTTGAGFSTQAKLPTNSIVSLEANTDRTGAENSGTGATTSNTYDAQISQPVANLPLSAQLKGHIEELRAPGSPPGRMPSLEQSLTWKPAEDTTVQMGLRQQQYQEYPGVDNQFNQAIFADLSHKIIDNVTWHSYGELMNTRGLVDAAPLSALASGAFGTQQATGPGDNISPGNSVPLSLQDQTLTLSTGPSFQLQKDISASVEYSDRWDKNPAPGSVGQEQRVSLSVKGSF